MGRPKGAQNKLSREGRNAVLRVFELMGGIEAFAAWAKEHPSEFYLELFSRLVPREIALDADVSGGGVQQVVVQAVQVANPGEAVNALEKLQNEYDARLRGEALPAVADAQSIRSERAG